MKLLIHIENRVDPRHFNPGGLTQFNLARFRPNLSGWPDLNRSVFWPERYNRLNHPGRTEFQNIMFNPQIFKLLLFFVYNP